MSEGTEFDNCTQGEHWLKFYENLKMLRNKTTAKKIKSTTDTGTLKNVLKRKRKKMRNIVTHKYFDLGNI